MCGPLHQPRIQEWALGLLVGCNQSSAPNLARKQRTRTAPSTAACAVPQSPSRSSSITISLPSTWVFLLSKAHVLSSSLAILRRTYVVAAADRIFATTTAAAARLRRLPTSCDYAATIPNAGWCLPNPRTHGRGRRLVHYSASRSNDCGAFERRTRRMGRRSSRTECTGGR
jgi:hypothetical protein